MKDFFVEKYRGTDGKVCECCYPGSYSLGDVPSNIRSLGRELTTYNEYSGKSKDFTPHYSNGIQILECVPFSQYTFSWSAMLGRNVKAIESIEIAWSSLAPNIACFYTKCIGSYSGTEKYDEIDTEINNGCS